jgi:hypothetical protein
MTMGTTFTALALWCLPSLLFVGFAEWRRHRIEDHFSYRNAVIVPFPAGRIYRRHAM